MSENEIDWLSIIIRVNKLESLNLYSKDEWGYSIYGWSLYIISMLSFGNKCRCYNKSYFLHFSTKQCFLITRYCIKFNYKQTLPQILQNLLFLKSFSFASTIYICSGQWQLTNNWLAFQMEFKFTHIDVRIILLKIVIVINMES